jgi:hypothetical protein
MVKPSRWTLVALAAALVAAAAFLGPALLRSPTAIPKGQRSARPSGDDEKGEIPRIDLARLDKRPKIVALGCKDLFQYGPSCAELTRQAEVQAAAPTPRVAVMTPPPTLPPPPPTPAVPPLNLKYVGTVESAKQGVRVAVLLTDRQEVLTGQVGELVANRFRIVKIGYESVDIQDVGSERVRRIPYKGN